MCCQATTLIVRRESWDGGWEAGCRARQVKDIREVKHDVYGKRQTAKIELLVSDFSRLYNLGKLFAFTVIKGFFSYFSTGFI